MSSTDSSETGGKSSARGLLLAIFLPAAVGSLLAGGVLGGLVYSQTQAPETNPASKQVLVYGE